MNQRFQCLTGVLITLCSVFFWSQGTSIAGQVTATDSDPLLRYRGNKLVCEFPTLEDVGDRLLVPEGWQYIQVTADMYEAVSKHLDPRYPVAILYFDEYGNLLKRDHSKNRRLQVRRGAIEVERKISRLLVRLDQDWKEIEKARADQKDDLEVELLLASRKRNVRGYSVAIRVVSRLFQIENERLRELWQTLASEGLVKQRALSKRLGKLASRSVGLAIEVRIESEKARIDRGWHTAQRQRSEMPPR